MILACCVEGSPYYTVGGTLMILACCVEGSPYYTVGGTLMILACCVEGSPYYTVGDTLMILACCVEGSPYYALCEYFPSSHSSFPGQSLTTSFRSCSSWATGSLPLSRRPL